VELAPTGRHAAVYLTFLALDDRMAQVALTLSTGQDHPVSILDQVEGVFQLSLGLLLLLGECVNIILDLLLIELQLLVDLVLQRKILNILLLYLVLQFLNFLLLIVDRVLLLVKLNVLRRILGLRVRVLKKHLWGLLWLVH
jgi:hypothetical protein